MDNKTLEGWLSIYSDLMDANNRYIQDFIDFHKDNLGQKQWMTKAQVVYMILATCVNDIELRKSLQDWFGQFSGAQICLNCGKVMWEGYSWMGDTYCCIDCIQENENITLSDIEDFLKDADTPDGEYYYTDWG